MTFKTVFSLLFCAASLSTFGQIGARSNYIGGSFTIEHKFRSVGSFGGDNKITSVPIAFNYGRFITPRLAIGMGVGYNYFKEVRRNSSKDSTETYSLPIITFVPQAKYFFPIWNNKFFFVANLNLGYGIQLLRIDLASKGGNEILYKGNRFLMDLNIRPSLVYFLNPHFALEATFGYFGYTRVLRTDSRNNLGGSRYDYGVKLSLDPTNINIGLNYFFKGKDKTNGKDELKP